MKAVLEGDSCLAPSGPFFELIHKAVNKAKQKEYLSQVQLFLRNLYDL